MVCYYPNGQIADGLKPCINSTTVASHCCRDSDVCVTNGFCFSAGSNTLIRRGCTDQSFNSSTCPQFCTEGAYRNADAVMLPCDNYNFFCCGQDQAARNCCSTGHGTVHIVAGAAILPKAEISSATISTAITSPPTSSYTSAAATEDCGPLKNTAIGVGVTLGVILLAGVFLSFLFWKARRREGASQGLVQRTKQELRDAEQKLKDAVRREEASQQLVQRTNQRLRDAEEQLRGAQQRIADQQRAIEHHERSWED